MRVTGYTLLAVGIILAIIGLINKLGILHLGFSLAGHSNLWIIGAGGVIVLVGIVLSFMADRSAAK